MKLGRLPLRASPRRVNWLTAISCLLPSRTLRFIFPASSSKIRSCATLRAIHSTSSSESPLPTPSRTSRPGPISLTRCPSTVTDAERTRCTTLRIARPFREQSLVSALSRLLPRIDRVAQRVPQQVEAEHGERDGQPGKERHMRGHQEVLCALIHQRPPRRCPGRRAQSEEAERGLGEDRAGNGESRLHQDRPGGIRQQVPEQDAT